MRINEDFLLDILMENDVLNDESKQQVVDLCQKNSITVGQATEQCGIMSADDVLMLLAAEFDLETIKIDQCNISEEVISLVPADIAKRYSIIPISREDDQLIIAMANPADVQVFDALSHLLNMDVQGVISPVEDIYEAYLFHYGS